MTFIFWTHDSRVWQRDRLYRFVLIKDCSTGYCEGALKAKTTHTKQALFGTWLPSVKSILCSIIVQRGMWRQGRGKAKNKAECCVRNFVLIFY